MSLPYQTLENPPAAAHIPDGGTLVVGENVVVPGEFGAMTTDGVGFGPLHLGVPHGATVTVTNLGFEPGGERDGLLAGATLAAGGAATKRDTIGEHTPDRKTLRADGDVSTPDDEGPRMTRRAVFGAAIGLATAALGVGTVAASDDGDVTLRVARFTVAEADGPLHISALDLVDQVLPPEAELLVDVSGTRVGGVADPGEGVSVDDEALIGEEVRVYLRGSIAIWWQILAWAAGQLPGETEVTYSREFPDGRQATDFDESEFVELSDHPGIVDPIRRVDHNEVLVEVGNTPIPHESEGSTGEGAWSLFDDALIYEVGRNPPAASEYHITIGLGLIARIMT